MRKVFTLLVLLLSGAWLLHAQTIPDDIKKLNEKMSHRHFSYSATYSLYNAYEGGSLMESQQIDVNLWDAMLSIKTKLFHVIKNREYYLYVDLSRKVMMLNKVSAYKNEIKELNLLKSLVNVDSLTGNMVRTQLLNEKDRVRTYRFYYKYQTPYAYTDLAIDTRNYQVVKAVMYFKESLTNLLGKHNEQAANSKPRIEMVFRGFTYDQKPSEKAFSTSAYLLKKGKQFTPQPLYAKYQFINNTTEKK